MPAPSTSEELLALVRKSGLVEGTHLQAYLQLLQAESELPADPQALHDLLVRDGLLTGFQAAQLLQGRWRGFVLGEYQILRPLGKGGMGTVFLARQGPRGRQVALKVLSSAHRHKPTAVKRFRREARALACLDHPGIVRAYGLEQHEQSLFLVLEYVEGVSLHDVVRQNGPLEVSQAADYVRQAALGLAHAHEAGWVHRDVKPGNLLLTGKGTIKILDLGLARLCEEDDHLTRSANVILGTVDYLAPEQSVDSHAVDARADVYGLGATFYHLLTGQAPFSGSTTDKIAALRADRPPPVRSLRPEVPAELEAIVERMMAKKPEQRYPSLSPVAAALAPWARAGASRAAPVRAAATLSAGAPTMSQAGPSTAVALATPPPAEPAPPVPEPELAPWLSWALAGLALAAALALIAGLLGLWPR